MNMLAVGIRDGFWRLLAHGEPTPLAPELDVMFGKRLSLREGQRLRLEWTLRGLV